LFLSHRNFLSLSIVNRGHSFAVPTSPIPAGPGHARRLSRLPLPITGSARCPEVRRVIQSPSVAPLKDVVDLVRAPETTRQPDLALEPVTPQNHRPNPAPRRVVDVRRFPTHDRSKSVISKFFRTGGGLTRDESDERDVVEKPTRVPVQRLPVPAGVSVFPFAKPECDVRCIGRPNAS
jgi:hypothetical protein